MAKSLEKILSSVGKPVRAIGRVALPLLVFGVMNYGCSLDVSNRVYYANNLKPKIRVSKVDYLEAGDILNVKIDVNSRRVAGLDKIKVKYYFLNENKPIPKPGDKDFYKNLIYVGENSFKTKDGLRGFFEYDPCLKGAFGKGSAKINPLVNSSDTSKNVGFEFLVEFYEEKNGKDIYLTSKFWGLKDIKKDGLTIKFARSRREKYGKKDFYFSQRLMDNHLDDKILSFGSCGIGHFWDNDKLIYSENVARDFVSKWKKNGASALGMYSLFHKEDIVEALSSPELYSKKIVEKVRSVGADGVVVDFEDVKLDSSYSFDFVNFMKTLKMEFNRAEKRDDRDYTVGVAVSPRFEGSGRDVFLHHGFYDYGALDTIAGVDYLFAMGYDFNVGRVGPGLPKNKIDLIVDYSEENLKNDDKFVFSFPFYGRVFDKDGREKGVLAENNNKNYLDSKGARVGFRDGELVIETKNRIVYTQSPKVHKWRLNKMDLMGVKNVAFWKKCFADPKSINEIRMWKNRNPTNVVKKKTRKRR